jgi:predicted TIM-barrel fold metal-dependent hydrolase
VDWSRIPVVDGFGHLFDPGRSGERGGRLDDPGRTFYSFAREWSIGALHPSPDRMEQTLVVQRVVRELALLLGCDPDPEIVTKTRDTAYLRDPRGYVERLWNAASIEMVIFDTGAPTVEDVSLESIRTLLPCPFRTIHRIDAAIHDLLIGESDFDEALTAFRRSIDRAVQEDRPVALKSVGSTFTGLDVELFEEEDARRAYSELRSTGRLVPRVSKTRSPDESIYSEFPIEIHRRHAPREEKVVRDFLLTEGMRKALEYDIPFNFHTALGGGPYFDMNRAHPFLLHDVLANDELRKTKIVLVHGGYPWAAESGYLANQFDNVYVDLGEMFPMSGPGMKSRFAALLEMAPVNKIMFGSDGFGIPEVFWFAAVQGKRSVKGALEDLEREGWVLHRQAEDIARMVFGENARKLYRLDS